MCLTRLRVHFCVTLTNPVLLVEGDLGEGERTGHDVETGGVGTGREGGRDDQFREGEPGCPAPQQGLHLPAEHVESQS